MFGIGKGKKKEEKEKILRRDEMEAKDDKPTEPDVILDIPELKVDEIKIKVRDLEAHVSVDAKFADFVQVEAGISAHIGKVDIEIEDVRVEAYLKVRLERVKAILNRTVATLNNNPELLKAILKPIAEGGGKATEGVGEAVGNVVGQIGEGAKNGMQSMVAKTGDALSKIKLRSGIKKMLKNVNIL